MTRQEFMEIASPPCHECGAPINCTEQKWCRIWDDDTFVVSEMHMVCVNGHRVRVEAFV